MKKMIGLVKLGLETGKSLEEVSADIQNFCMDNYEMCSSETLMTWEDTKMNRTLARLELAAHESEAHEVGRYVLATAYVLEFYQADDNGEFISGSDYDW